MTVRERVLTLKLLEKQKKHPELMKQMGIEIKIIEKEEQEKLS